MSLHSAGFRPRIPSASGCILLPLVSLTAVCDAAAQEPGDPDVRAQSVHAVERPTYMAPAFGPPGTEVTLRASLLPALTPVQVALGGTRSGFEALALALTDRNGDLVETVTIPAWASRERAHRFIVFNAYFSAVYAATGLFHVTDTQGKLLREGAVTKAGPGCPTMSGVDNEIYSLVGQLEPVREGARVHVEGSITESDECPEGVALQVVTMEQAPGGG